jgi:hypothetical protein
MALRINPDLGDSVAVERLPGNSYQLSFWYVLDGGDKTLYTFTLPDDFVALTDEQQDQLLFDWALQAARVQGVLP